MVSLSCSEEHGRETLCGQSASQFGADPPRLTVIDRDPEAVVRVLSE